MPNWSYTDIVIKGSKTDIDGFIEKYALKVGKEDNGFTFDKIIPEPKDINDCPADCRTKGDDHIEIDEKRPWFNWYEWHTKYWGTKWDACNVIVERESDTTLLIGFDTAWAVPAPILKELKRQNPNLRFYFETYGEDW